MSKLFETKNLAKDIGTGILFGSIFAAMGIIYILQAKLFVSAMYKGLPFWLVLINYIGGIFIVPVIEEIIFRGYRKALFDKRKSKFWKALLVTSFAFAIWHANHFVIPIAFIGGLLLYFAYQKSTTLLVPTLAHMLYNLVMLPLFRWEMLTFF